jgi:hypothetical protein
VDVILTAIERQLSNNVIGEDRIVRNRIPGLAAALVLVLSLWAQNASTAAEKPSALVDKLFQKMDTTVSPGCALSVIRDGKIIYERGYSSEEIDPLYELKIEDGRLVLYRLKNKPDPLQPVAQDLFKAEVGTIRFTRNPRGEISGFLLSTGRIRNFRFRRGAASVPEGFNYSPHYEGL